MDNKTPAAPKAAKLWTRDFTIITIGSLISMLGNAMSGFAISLMVLDYTNSPLLYAIFIAIFTLPQMIMPIFSGAILDRFSRKKTIYTLDFLSAGIFLAVGLLLGTGWFNFPVFAFFCFIVGSIESIYMVAYESFYPLLISEGNYSKAYSIASVLETMTALMIPVSTYVYNLIGIAPLMEINAVCFLIAAILETRIGAEEKYIQKQLDSEGGDQRGSVKLILRDIREGFKYLTVEKGLLAIAVYFAFTSLAGGASSVITLPFFKGHYDNGEYIYMLVWGMAVLGRAIGGALLYKIKLPNKHKYAIALTVYIVTSLAEGFYLYCGIPVMMVLCFMTGILGVTSYNIRISATQSYVPDEKKGRFNGAFNMLNTVGSFSGEMIAGALTTVIPVRGVLTAFMLLNALAAVAFIGCGKSAVAPIFQRHESAFGSEDKI